MDPEIVDPYAPKTAVEDASRASNKPRTKSIIRTDKPSAIELVNVVKAFGAKRAVDGVSFEVPDGSVFGLIGPNGAGKTTTFSMLAGYLKPTSGDVYVLDHTPGAVDALKGRVGVLPQDALLPANEAVGDFLVYLARLQGLGPKAEKAAREVLAEVDGSAWWTTRCGTLSHGMAKRVGLAQAFLGDPEVVLLDEPTAGLTKTERTQVGNILSALAHKYQLCCLLVEHDLDFVKEIATRIVVLHQGRLVESGTHQALLRQGGHYAQFYQVQAHQTDYVADSVV
jgi:ABC-type multidrug transport system ATPase subunit